MIKECDKIISGGILYFCLYKPSFDIKSVIPLSILTPAPPKKKTIDLDFCNMFYNKAILLVIIKYL